MRCKVGDLAVIVRSRAGNEGKIVRCLEFRPAQGFIRLNGSTYKAEAWRVDVALPTEANVLTSIVRDRNLRPIRPDEGTDETLLWAGLPKETVNA